MNVRKSARFVGDLAHMFLLGIVFVAGLTVQTAVALGSRRLAALRGSLGPRGKPTHTSPDTRGD